MAILHFAQGVAMVILSKEILTDISLWLPKPNPQTRIPDLTPEVWFSVNTGYVISAFLFTSALAHLITILPGVYEWYVKNLKVKMNLIRWYEYAVSSSIMILVIAILCGIRDGSTLFLLVGVNAAMNLFGASMEMHNSSLRKIAVLENPELAAQEDPKFKPNWSHFVYGCIVGVLPWIIMSIYFFTILERVGRLDEVPQNVKDVLNTVRWIFPILFLFFNLFAINMFLQYKQLGPWKKYLFGEKSYIILSLVAKSFLAWFIWGGTLR